MPKPLHFDSTARDLDLRRPRVLAELHPALRVKVEQILTQLGGRVTPYCGYRGPHEQQDARRAGNSRASFGESPHNYHPALACDFVLDPRLVEVDENSDPTYPGFPDLWCERTSAAEATWADLDAAAIELGLERVVIFNRKDQPHVQLPGWAALAKIGA